MYGYVNKACIAFSCRSACDECFTASWRPIKQESAAYFSSKGLKKLGLLERIDDVHSNLLFKGFQSAHIFKSDTGPLDNVLGDIMLPALIARFHLHAYLRAVGQERVLILRVRQLRIAIDRILIIITGLLIFSEFIASLREHQVGVGCCGCREGLEEKLFGFSEIFIVIVADAY